MTSANASPADLGAIYPEPPAGVPADLTKPTSKYRRHAWFALIGLFVFAVLYLALTAWFSW